MVGQEKNRCGLSCENQSGETRIEPVTEEQPVLAWQPVDGAASYRLVASASDGSPYWAWLGEATEVRFGGAPEAGGHTAIVFEPMTWRVIALDADGLPIAASESGALTP